MFRPALSPPRHKDIFQKVNLTDCNFAKGGVLYWSVRVTVFSILLLIICGVAAVSQTPDTNRVLLLSTNRFPDGSTIKIDAVSYGEIHRIPWSSRQQEFFKSASPTIMFTTSRQAAAGLYLGGGAWDLWTKAEALDMSGSWYPLRSRVEPRPVKEGFEDEGLSYEGSPPAQCMETWEFPSCPEPSAWVRVRIWATKGYINCACVEFKLPNDNVWRERSIEGETNDFHPQEWLNDELFRAVLQEDTEYAKDLIAQGADPNSCDSEGRSLLSIVCQQDRKRDMVDVWSNFPDHGFVTAEKIARMVATSEDRHRRMVRLLVERGADINARAEFGWTPLILAARGGDIESVKYLLSKGADPNIKDEEGESIIEPIERTQSTNRLEIIKILKRAQATH